LKTFNKRVLKIETQRLLIRTLRSGDVTKKYVDGLNDPEVNRYLEIRWQRQTKPMVERYVEQNLKSSNNLLLGLFLKESKSFIGTIRLSNISYHHYLASLGICLFDKKIWGQGYGLEALCAVRDFVFSRMGIRCIEAGIYEEHAASLKVFKKCGFKFSVRFLKQFRLNDRFVNTVYYRCLNPNFQLPRRGK